jgi:tetratricopeptide (TPR) repeat protein
MEQFKTRTQRTQTPRGLAALGAFALIAIGCLVALVATLYSPSPERATERTTMEKARSLVEAGRWAEARRAFEEALKADPKDTDALRGAAECEARLGDHQAAALLWQRYIGARPNEATGYRGAAKALATLGRHDEALAYAQTARSMSSSPDPDLESLISSLVMRPAQPTAGRPGLNTSPHTYTPQPLNPSANDWIRK